MTWDDERFRELVAEVQAEAKAPQPDEDGSDSLAESWTERDLVPVVAGILGGTITRPAPTIGRRDDGACLFYPARVNSLFGGSGDSKTHIALETSRQEIAEGRHVGYLDFEDDVAGICTRLLDLGAEPDAIVERFHYFSPSEPFGLVAQVHVREMIGKYNPSLVVLDSAGEAMAVDGVKPNDDDAVARWMRQTCRFIAALGPGVLFVDHVPKSKDRDPLFAIGSQRKRAAVTGAAYLVEVVHEFGIGKSGRSKLTVAKDRCGHYVRGTRAAEFTLDATTTPYRAALESPHNLTGTASFEPTALMEKASRYVETHPGLSKRAILEGVGGKRAYAELALELLTTRGYLRTESGQRGALHHHSQRPYREADPEEAPSDD